MRTEDEMMRLINRFVDREPNIRVAILNGSRANPNAKRDPFQDYDISCYVKDVSPFQNNREFLSQFGDLMILQTPEDMVYPPPTNDGHFVYLMQFTDGNRIDLSFCPIHWLETEKHESLSSVLIDKDHLVQNLPPASDKDFIPKKPTSKAFEDCCNEFWWVCPYVAKALWREELIHAKALQEQAVRTPLLQMVTWHFAIETHFEMAPGKDGKYIKQALDPNLWTKLEATYSDAIFENIWNSLFSMGNIFRSTAKHVANVFGFTYPEKDDQNVTAHLLYVRQLPKDADTLYPLNTK